MHQAIALGSCTLKAFIQLISEWLLISSPRQQCYKIRVLGIDQYN